MRCRHQRARLKRGDAAAVGRCRAPARTGGGRGSAADQARRFRRREGRRRPHASPLGSAAVPGGGGVRAARGGRFGRPRRGQGVQPAPRLARAARRRRGGGHADRQNEQACLFALQGLWPEQLHLTRRLCAHLRELVRPSAAASAGQRGAGEAAACPRLRPHLWAAAAGQTSSRPGAGAALARVSAACPWPRVGRHFAARALSPSRDGGGSVRAPRAAPAPRRRPRRAQLARRHAAHGCCQSRVDAQLWGGGEPRGRAPTPSRRKRVARC
mmetsp:Transcript_16589/g.52526  ORF Transcript_16589/g.52526 Transcript_16589/m.52526 type:complete len:270 (+) Transcript_16589:630-1439(+)